MLYKKPLKEIREISGDMKRFLRMKCKTCGYWNRIEVNKLFVEQETSEPEVKAIIPMYKPL